MARFGVGPGERAAVDGKRTAIITAVAVALLLTVAGTASVWGVGGLHLSSLSCQTEMRLGAHMTGVSIGASTGDAGKYMGDEAVLGNCTVPKLNISGLLDYGCRVLNDSCFDQHRIIVYNPPDDLEFPYPFLDMGWTETWVPGWTALNKTGAGPIGTGNAQPQVRKNSTADRPDLTDPLFSACHTPLVWNSPYHIAFGEFFDNSFVPLWDMQHQRNLFDENIQLAPVLDGYRMQPFMENLLRPYTNKPLMSFNDISSREHATDPRFPRCFKKIVMCGLKGLYKDRPPPAYLHPVYNATMYNGDKNWTWFQPAQAGKHLVDYYRQAKKIPKLAEPKDKDTLQVVVGNRTAGYRQFLNLTEFLRDCNEWQPPAPYKRTRCLAISVGPEGFLEHVAVLSQTDIMIAHHGAELCNGFFLPWGSSVVEVRMKDFQEDWDQVYFPSMYRTENNILYWTARVVNDSNWAPAAWERDGAPNHIYAIERNSRLLWEQWEPIFRNITAVRRDKEAYEKLEFRRDVYFEI
ncbi:hypothetical protein ACK3TF_002897 [Chlorella vulgaris]